MEIKKCMIHYKERKEDREQPVGWDGEWQGRKGRSIPCFFPHPLPYPIDLRMALTKISIGTINCSVQGKAVLIHT